MRKKILFWSLSPLTIPVFAVSFVLFGIGMTVAGAVADFADWCGVKVKIIND